jgi:hypothetical protein
MPRAKWIQEIQGGFAGQPTGYRKQDPWITRDYTDELKPLQGIQETVSEDHPGWRQALKENGTNADVGGDFTMTKRYVSSPSPVTHRIVSPWYADGGISDPQARYRYTYQGPLYLAVGPVAFPPFAQSSDNDLAKFGTTAIARCAPTNSVADVSTAILETWHDGLPKLIGMSTWGDRTLRAQSAGEEYLNVEFGWKPLVADVTDFIVGVKNLNKLITQYIRDSGKPVRRRYSFPPVTSQVTTKISDTTNIGGPGDNTGSMSAYQYTGHLYRTRFTRVDRWFSGCFTYYLPPVYFPDLGDNTKQISAAMKVLGTDLNPETLYNIAPWSWAIDWFSNTGDVIHNLNAFANDGLVLKYGYIMEHSTVRDVYHFWGDLGLRAGIDYPFVPTDLVLTSEVKLRRRATPFGFGLNLSSFTTRQKAITAALGLTRVR